MYVVKYKDKYRAHERFVINGVPHKVSVVMDRDTPQARRKAAEQLLAKKPHISSSATFEAVRKAYIADKKVSTKATTWSRDESTMKRIGTQLDRVKMSALSSGKVRQALLSLSTEPTTLNEYLKRLKTCIRWAYQNDYIATTDCVDKIKRWDDKSKREKVKDKYLERDELKDVIKHASDFDGLIIEFLALSGLRIGELIALDKEDVSDCIHVTKNYDYLHKLITTPKTPDSVRDVFVQPELKKCIAKINKMSNVHRMASGIRAPYFVVNAYGGRLSYPGFTHRFAEVTEKVTRRRLTPHSLRHTHASLLAEQGVPIATISRRLGHHSSSITESIYTHVTKNIKQNDAEIISKVSLL